MGKHSRRRGNRKFSLFRPRVPRGEPTRLRNNSDQLIKVIAQAFVCFGRGFPQMSRRAERTKSSF